MCIPFGTYFVSLHREVHTTGRNVGGHALVKAHHIALITTVTKATAIYERVMNNANPETW
jgi:hypothetical protein